MMPNVFMHTYIICIYRIYRTQWSIHMNAICKYDSHPVTQSFTRPALLFTHTIHSTQIWNHKRDNQPSSIVLNRKTGLYSDSASLYAFRGAACFLEHSGAAGKGQRFPPKSGWGAPKCGNTQYPKYYLDLIESEARESEQGNWVEQYGQQCCITLKKISIMIRRLSSALAWRKVLTVFQRMILIGKLTNKNVITEILYKISK